MACRRALPQSDSGYAGPGVSRAAPAREAPVICLHDLIGFCDLKPDEIHAIAEHEQIAESLAAALGASLLQSRQGTGQIRDMLLDDMRIAIRRRDIAHARHIVTTLRHFVHE